MSETNSPYDTNADAQPVHRSSEDPDGHSRAANSASGSSDDKSSLSDQEKSPDRKTSSGSSNESSASPKDLLQSESAAGEHSKFNPNDSSMPGYKFLQNAIKKRGKLALGGGGIAGILSAVVIGLFSLIPLKVESMVENVQNHFFSSAENAAGKETDHLLKNYMVRYVLPSYKNCGTTVSRSCRVGAIGGSSTNPVKNLYTTWAHAKFENKLADGGIEFRHDKASNTWHLKAPGTSSSGVDIGKDGEKFDTEFNKTDRAGMRQAVRDAMKNETRWKKVMYRFKVGRLLETKYGIKRCIVFCGKRDAFSDKKEAKKTVAKLYLVQRVIAPRNKNLGIVIKCLLENCDAKKTEPTDGSESPALSGAPENPDTDTKVRQSMADLASKYSAQNVDELIKLHGEISERGFQKYFATKVFATIVSDEAAAKAADAIPIIGWINLGAQIISTADHAGPNIKKLSYVVNAAAAVQAYNMYRTYADEVHTGHVDSTEVGSFTDSLGPGDYTNQKDRIVGGSASAESSPLYQNLINHRSASSITTVAPETKSISLLDGLAFAKTYATSGTSSTPTKAGEYTCANGKSVSSGKLVCDEEQLGGGNGIANALHDFLNSPILSPLTIVADAWNTFFKPLTDAVGDAFTAILNVTLAPLNAACDVVPDYLNPTVLYCKGKQAAEKAIPDILQGVTQSLIPNPYSSNMSGGRNFHAMAAGADVSGNDFAHTGLGGQQLSPVQHAAITNEQERDSRESFQHQPMFARMFSTTNQNSLVSRLALVTPTSATGAANSTVAAMTHPFSSIGHSFGSLFSSKVNAATVEDDPFGVTQYGYPEGTIPSDPETYWDQHCDEKPGQAYQNDAEFAAHGWNKDAADPANVDPNTSMPTNKTTNACLLIKSSSGSAGAIYNTDLLTDDEKSVLGNSQATSSSAGAATSNASARDAAKQILASGNVDTSFNSSIKADLQAAADGKNGTAGVPTSAAILNLILAVSKDHKVALTAIQSNGQGHCKNTPKSGCPNDPHYTGDGVDFGSLDGATVTGRDAGSITIMKIAFGVLPKGSGFGQSNCGTTPKLPDGFITFNDSCNHLHVQVVKGTP